MTQQRPNSGTLFANDFKGENPLRPDYKGKCMVNGVEMEMAAWIKGGENGKKKFMSISFSEPRQKDTPKQEQKKLGEAPDMNDDLDGIPF
jgi:hypothetical protein